MIDQQQAALTNYQPLPDVSLLLLLMMMVVFLLARKATNEQG